MEQKIFPVFCTADASTELLTTFLLHSAEWDRSGHIDEFVTNNNVPISQMHTGEGSVTGCVILRSETLSTITEQTPLPIGGLPEPLAPTPFKNWTPELCLRFLTNHAPNTRVHEGLFIVLDEQSAQDYTCLVCENGYKFSENEDMRSVARELKTVRTTFRESTIALCNLDVANMGIEDYEGGPIQGKKDRKKDLEQGVLDEHLLRDGTVVRPK